MKKVPGVETASTNVVTVLSIGSEVENQTALKHVFGQSEWTMCPNFKWKLTTKPTLDSALTVLRNKRIPVVLCECGPQRDTWKEALERFSRLPAPPFVIVTSRLADERFWVEALNLGAYDVLATPLDTTEVTRVVSSAWLHWRGLQAPSIPPQSYKRLSVSAA